MLLSAQQVCAERVRGASLTLYGEIPELGLTYSNLLQEMSREGFTHVSLVTHLPQERVTSAELALNPHEAERFKTLRRLMGEARALGLKVILFPIIWLEERDEGVWRGVLKPSEPARWWASYRAVILRYASLAEQGGAWALSVGSELSAQEGEEARWRSLITEARARFKGALTYSANWDHFDHVPFWSALDIIGISAYYEIASYAESSVEEMKARWSQVRWSLLDWRARAHPSLPLLFTELGYPSHAEGAIRPWHYSASREVNVEVQRRAFQAFREVWQGDQALMGAFLWTWWGLGGHQDAWYTLRGKPAMREVRAWLKP